MTCALCQHKESIPRSAKVTCLLTGREEYKSFCCVHFEGIKPHADDATDEELDFDDGFRPI